MWIRSCSFIRGQNAPIDPKTLSERATKRLRALEFQTAIKEQLAEREHRRQTDREQRVCEERRLEEQMQRQLEAERNAFEVQVRQQREQHEAEQRRQDAMRAALQRAEEEARADREKRKRDRAMMLAAAATKIAKEAAAKKEEALRNANDGTNHLGQQMHDEQPVNGPKERADLDDAKYLIGSPINMRKSLHSSNKSKTASNELDETPIGAKHSESPIGISIAASTTATATVANIPTLSGMVTPNAVNNSTTNGFVSVPMPPNAVISLNNLQFAVMLAHQIEQLAPSNLLAKLHTNSCANSETESRADNTTATVAMLCDRCQSKPASATSATSAPGQQNVSVAELAVEATEAMICANVMQVACMKLPHDGTFTKETAAETDTVRTMDRATQTERPQKKIEACETCSVTMHAENEIEYRTETRAIETVDAESEAHLEVCLIKKYLNTLAVKNLPRNLSNGNKIYKFTQKQ